METAIDSVGNEMEHQLRVAEQQKKSADQARESKFGCMEQKPLYLKQRERFFGKAEFLRMTPRTTV